MVELSELEWKEVLGALTMAEILMEQKDYKQKQVERIRSIKTKIYRGF